MPLFIGINCSSSCSFVNNDSHQTLIFGSLHMVGAAPAPALAAAFIN